MNYLYLFAFDEFNIFLNSHTFFKRYPFATKVEVFPFPTKIIKIFTFFFNHFTDIG